MDVTEAVRSHLNVRIRCTSDLIFFNSGALPNILHYITYITLGHTTLSICLLIWMPIFEEIENDFRITVCFAVIKCCICNFEYKNTLHITFPREQTPLPIPALNDMK